MDTPKQKFTPGPWTLAPDLPSIVETDEEPPRTIAGMGSAFSREEIKANARLISQAPDMYRALLEFIHMWNSGDSHSTSKRAQKRRSDMWDHVNSVISAVEGR